MSLYSRIAWKEGMLLAPQHFQQTERARDASVQLRIGGAHPLAWGILELTLDEIALRSGRVSVQRCRAVLPDGTTLDAPDVDPVPPSRIVELPSSARSLDLFLTLPVASPQTQSMVGNGSRPEVRFYLQTLEIPDALAPSRTLKVDVALKNVRLAVGGEPLQGLIALRIARIVRNPDGQLAYDPNYIPPLLIVRASPRLDRMARELIALITGRARAMVDERRPKGLDLEMLSGSVTGFLFMQTLFRHLPVLQRLVDAPDTTASRLFEALLMLAGDLYCFEMGPELGVPSYDHEALFESFQRLDARLRGLLQRPFQARYMQVPFAPRGRFWLAEVADEGWRSQSEWILAVSSDSPPAELNTRLPGVIRLAETEQIERFILGATGSLRIAPLPRAPAAIPVNPEACYFRIETEGREWNAVRTSGKLAAFFPSFLHGLKVDLYILRT